MHDALPIAGFTQPTNEISGFSLIYVHICLHDEPKVPFEYECKQLVLHRLAETCPKSQTLEFRPTFKLKYAFFFSFYLMLSVDHKEHQTLVI